MWMHDVCGCTPCPRYNIHTSLLQHVMARGWTDLLIVHLTQKHYDFGMRALKAVLTMAGQLKRAAPKEAEALVALQVLREANLPKLLTDVRRESTGHVPRAHAQTPLIVQNFSHLGVQFIPDTTKAWRLS